MQKLKQAVNSILSAKLFSTSRFAKNPHIFPSREGCRGLLFIKPEFFAKLDRLTATLILVSIIISLNTAFAQKLEFDIGYDLYKKGLYNKAIDAYTEAIAKAPKKAIYYLYRGNARSQLDDEKGAHYDYTKAIELDSQYANAYFYRGSTRINMDNYEGAIEDFNKTIELDPGQTNAYFSRGKAKAHLGDYEGAIKDYSKTIEMNNRKRAAYFERAATYKQLGKWELALRDYDHILNNFPNRKAFADRGLVKIELGDINEACSDFKNAHDLGNIKANQYLNKYCKKSDNH